MLLLGRPLPKFPLISLVHCFTHTTSLLLPKLLQQNSKQNPLNLSIYSQKSTYLCLLQTTTFFFCLIPTKSPTFFFHQIIQSSPKSDQIPSFSQTHTSPNSKKMKSLLIFTLFTLFFTITFSFQDTVNSHHQFPRPLILEYTDGGGGGGIQQEDDELYLQCTSWRFGVEANNINSWKTIPKECADYVKNYVMGKGYNLDLVRVSNEASDFAKSVVVGVDGKDVWVFDVDETLISNLPYYVDHGFGLEVFDGVVFDKWVDKGAAPAIEPSLRLYEEVLSLGFKVFLLTGRSEKQRDVTVENLMDVGFNNWDKLILRAADDHGKTAKMYKSERRDEMVKEGYRIVGNSGDQWSDLLGSSMSIRSFKIPNPMYYIS